MYFSENLPGVNPVLLVVAEKQNNTVQTCKATGT